MFLAWQKFRTENDARLYELFFRPAKELMSQHIFHTLQQSQGRGAAVRSSRG
jgi:hypothetical protein